MIEYTPDKWKLLKFTYQGESITKVLGTWSGSYLWGDSWRLNSGVCDIKEGGGYYLFYGSSGSVYKCHKDQEGVVGVSGAEAYSNIMLSGICEDSSVSKVTEEFSGGY